MIKKFFEVDIEETQSSDVAPILDTKDGKDTAVEVIDTKPISETSKHQVKWWVWVLLIAALFSASSAATGLRKLENVPPLMKASWRLQVTSIVLFVGFLYHLYELWNPNTSKVDPEFTVEVRMRYFTPKTFGMILLRGTALAIYSGCWVASLNETSLAHSLLFSNCHPIIFVIGFLVVRLPISKGQVLGAGLGFIGLIITLLDTFINPTEGGDAPSFFGDFLAFLGALAIFVMTLFEWGRELSSYRYAFPVTLLSAVWLGIVSLIFEKHPLSLDGESYGIFGWASKYFILVVLYLAIVAKFIGCAGLNTVINYLDPVVISVTFLMEPVIGTFMGYFAGVSTLPGLFTFLGGPVFIGGCVWVILDKQLQDKGVVEVGGDTSLYGDKLGEPQNHDTNAVLQEVGKEKAL